MRSTREFLQVVRGSDVLATVRWSDIREILAYKYDRVNTDEICLGFVTKESTSDWLEISEEWEGFQEAMEVMQMVFPSIEGNWFGRVMIPAFKRNETVLWRSRPCGSDHDPTEGH